jgi:amidohydrolase
VNFRTAFSGSTALIAFSLLSAPPSIAADLSALSQSADQIESKVIDWRRDIHQHPELGNREFRTSKKVADHLRRLGFDEVRSGVAHTGVIGVLKGAHPGARVALRADMDALPVEEKTGLPYASKTFAEVDGAKVGVMHACGHDAHTAILMGVAEVLAGHRDKIYGEVIFIFQPAEEGAPEGEQGGAKLILKEGALKGRFKPDAIFGLHVWPGNAGSLSVRPKGAMAAADRLMLTVVGKQTHGSSPWMGVDPIAVAAQIMIGLQMIPARQLDVSTAPSVVTIGSIHGGVRSNIIPEKVEMQGTIRTFDPDIRKDLLARIERTATSIAESAGAKVEIAFDPYAPSVYNDPDLTNAIAPAMTEAAGDYGFAERGLVMGSEDFAHYQNEIPGVFFFLGVNPDGVDTINAAPNHSPYFLVNDEALKVGVKALSFIAVDYLENKQDGNAQ